jgi:chromate transporter
MLGANPLTAPPETPARGHLGEVARYFLRLGTVAFGGPAAHIAMMEDEVVRRRGWITHEAFLDLLAAANLLPGPSSTELAIFIGYQRAGWQGLIAAGVCFVLPAFLIVTGLAWAYVRFGALPAVAGILYGVKPVVIAVVLSALVGLGRTALKTRWLVCVGALTLAVAAVGASALPVLLLGAILGALPRLRDLRSSGPAALLAPVATLSAPFVVAGAVSLTPLFLVFLKVGAVVFGSGYVLLAFLQHDLVQRLGWLTEQQLIDAVAVGQVTPGPVFTTATFIGYVLAGMPGAAVATIGIFLPSFVFVALCGPVIPRIRRSPIALAALNGVAVASLALMAVVTWLLARTALIDAPTIALAVLSLVLLVWRRMNSMWLVAAGAALGLAIEILTHR